MSYVLVFLIGLVFSFVGSIPPGTLNICVLQLGLERKTAAALRFALAVSIIEYPYAWIGVQFEDWIVSSPAIVENFKLITAIVMTAMGVVSLVSSNKAIPLIRRFSESGFRRGIVLSILNPMAIPFWMVVTAYLSAQGWIDLSTKGLLHCYVLGTSVGAMLLLTVFIFLAGRISDHIQNNSVLKRLPGITLLVLGLYAFTKYLF